MASAYLCLGCGQIMGRWLGSCVICRSKNLVYYDNDRSPVMLERQRKIRGLKAKEASPAQAHLTVLVALTIFMAAGGYVINQWEEIAAHPAILALVNQTGTQPSSGKAPVKTSVASTSQLH